MLPVFALALLQSPSAIDAQLASRYFHEAEWIADEDHGRLWGTPLNGPMIFADYASHTVVANQDAPAMGLKRVAENVWVGSLPAQLTVSNTAIDWHGTKWTMVAWPLPTNRVERARLMMHELFHRIQDKVGLPPAIVKNNQLDTLQGRLWLQLEIKALRQAMLAEEPERTGYARKALLFRSYRQSLFPGSKKTEDRMEVHEGMAEFTGMMLRGTWEPETRYGLAYRMLSFPQKKSFPSSFAYETGPAYGLLLDVVEAIKFDKITWRKGLGPSSSLTDKLAALIAYQAPSNLGAAAKHEAKSFGYDSLLASEIKRDRVRAKQEADYRARLVNGPVLILPLNDLNYTYDPNEVFPLGELGSVFPHSTVIDQWGKLDASNGLLLAPDMHRAFVPAPKPGSPNAGDGWTLELKPGWKLVPAPRPGDYTLVKE